MQLLWTAKQQIYQSKIELMAGWLEAVSEGQGFSFIVHDFLAHRFPNLIDELLFDTAYILLQSYYQFFQVCFQTVKLQEK